MSDFNRTLLNQNVDIEKQLELARKIESSPEFYSKMFSWKGYPNSDQLKNVCDVIWEFFVTRSSTGVATSNQLHYKLSLFQALRDIGLFVREMVGNEDDEYGTIDKKIDQALDFLHQWVNFNMPRYLMAVSTIQKEILTKKGFPSGDFSYYARQMESFFTDSALAALDEYGIPLQISKKLQRFLQANGNLDEVIDRLKLIEKKQSMLTDFEWSFVEEVQGYI
jgi:hypothetical protein